MNRVNCEEMKILGNVLLGLCVLQLCVSSHSSDGPVVSCCHKTTQTMVARAKVKDYYIQERGGLCSIDAIVFITVKEKMICSNPDSPWAKKTADYINRKKMINLPTTTSSRPLSTETPATSWSTATAITETLAEKDCKRTLV